MIPKVLSLQVTLYVGLACLAIGGAAAVAGTRAFYKPRLDLAEYQIKVLGDSIRRQNDGVQQLEKDGKERSTRAAAAQSAASAAAGKARTQAEVIMTAQPAPGEDRCTAADALMRKELGR